MGTAYFGDIELISVGAVDVFAAKLDNEGNFIWARKAGGTTTNVGNAIAVHAKGNSYITGYFSGTAYFGDIELISAGAGDVFIAELDNEGNFIWARKAGGTASHIGFGIAIDSVGSIYIAGLFGGTAYFGDTALISAGEEDVFIARIGFPQTAVIIIKSSLVAGIYTWDYIEGKTNSLEEKGSRWTRISNKLNAKKIMTGDITGDGNNEIIVHFADDGLYYYSFEDNIWTNIAGAEANVIDFTLACTGYCDHKEIVAAVSDSISVYRDDNWVLLLLGEAESVIALNIDRDVSGFDKLVFASSLYGGLFIYDFQTASFSRICTVSPSQMTAGDVTGDGYPELAAVFDGYGTYLIRYIPGKSGAVKAYMTQYELFDLARDIRQNSQWVSKSKNGKGLQFNRLTWGAPDPGHLIAMGNIAGGTGSELFLVYQGRTYYYSYDTATWATFLYAPLKRIISGIFTAKAKDDLIVCDSSTGNIWLGKTQSSSWELLVPTLDTDAMGVLK